MNTVSKWLAEGGIETSIYRPDPEALRKDAILGPPKRVIEQLRERIERRLATELAVSMQMPGLDPRLAMRSLERFGAEMLPSLRKS